MASQPQEVNSGDAGAEIGELPERLRRVADARGVTLTGLGEEAGVADRTWSRYTSGETLPQLDVLARIVVLSGVSGHWLVTGDGPMYPEMEGRASAALREIAAIAARATAPPSDAELREQHDEGKQLEGEAGGTTDTGEEPQAQTG